MEVACFLLPVVLVLYWLNPAAAVGDGDGQDQFVFSGFAGSNLTLDGTATVTASGLLELTNGSSQLKGHAFFPVPLHFRASPGGTVRSFSASFVFAILSTYPSLSCHGIAFAVTPSTDLTSALAAQYMGLANIDDNGNATNHFFAAEIDTMQNVEFQDINNNHVGVDINGLRSMEAHEAGYYDDRNGSFHGMNLISGEMMQAWVEYDSDVARINVTIAPIGMSKPVRPLVSAAYNLSDVLVEPSYAGFSSATGPINSRHYILGWSFAMNNGPAPAIDIAKLPKLPRLGPKPRSKVLEILLPIATAAFIITLGIVAVALVRRRMRYAELREDWEDEFGPHRFSYKDLFHATDGFKDNHLLGEGGFGRVYKGVLSTSKSEVAVKKVSHESRQGMKEFVAEVVSIGRIRHRNLVQLLGYCRRKGELLLVYDYMPNGSLDKYLSCKGETPMLDWAQRFRIVKGVASGLLYLHEKWDKVVIHRDIKASNVLLDKEMNGRLGDFGLARLHDHGTDPQTTHMVGTMGYLAPELVRTGKASPLTDVFAFGTFLLEVTCGQRPIMEDPQGDQLLLVDWVLEHWHNGTLLETVDTRLQGNYNTDEACLVLRLGLLCSHPSANARPSMQQVMDYLDGDAPVPELASTHLSFNILALLQNKGLDPYVAAYPPSSKMSFGTISDISGGR